MFVLEFSVMVEVLVFVFQQGAVTGLILKNVLISKPTTINIYCSENVTTFPGFPYQHVRTWPPQKCTHMLYWRLCGFISKKTCYYRLIFFNMSSWMCVTVQVFCFSLFLSRHSVPRAQRRPREDLRQAGTWEWESNAAYIGISPHKRGRERERETLRKRRETAPMMSLQRTFSPSREAERCLETAASIGSSRAHQLRKRGT